MGLEVIESWTVPGGTLGHDGWNFRVTVTPDQDVRPETDGDWATPDIVDAWKRDEWEYVIVDVTPVDSKGRAWENDAQSVGTVVWGILDGKIVGRLEVTQGTVPDLVIEAMNSVANNR